MQRQWTALLAAVAAGLATALVLVLTIGGGAGQADAQGGNSLGEILREQKAINRRVRAAILRSNRANRDTASNRAAISGIGSTAGAQGPQGPQGPAGPPGVTGPPGPESPRAFPIVLAEPDAQEATVPGFGDLFLNCSGPELQVSWTNTTPDVQVVAGYDPSLGTRAVAPGARLFIHDGEESDARPFVLVVRHGAEMATVVGWGQSDGVSACDIQALATTT